MNAAVIVAAGRGSRMGLEKNKVLYPVCGEPMIARVLTYSAKDFNRVSPSKRPPANRKQRG